MRLIRIRKLIPLALGHVFPVAIYAQGWIKYVNEGDQFIVNFPAEPQLLEVDYTTESGAIIPSRLYSVENDNGRYAITVVDYTVAEQAHVARCRRMETELDIVSPNECGGRDHLSDIRGAIAFESWNIRRRSNGEITYDAFGQVDGVPGHQIQILHPDESRTFAALHMLDRRLSVLIVRIKFLGAFDDLLELRVRHSGDKLHHNGFIHLDGDYVTYPLLTQSLLLFGIRHVLKSGLFRSLALFRCRYLVATFAQDSHYTGGFPTYQA